jgi:hypothetical protein
MIIATGDRLYNYDMNNPQYDNFIIPHKLNRIDIELNNIREGLAIQDDFKDVEIGTVKNKELIIAEYIKYTHNQIKYKFVVWLDGNFNFYTRV